MNAKYTIDIGELNVKLKDIETKIDKTQNDKSNLEEKKSDNSNKMMNPEKYVEINDKIKKITVMIIPPKNMTTRKPLEMLLELERQLDKSLNMYKIIHQVELDMHNIGENDYLGLKKLPFKEVYNEIKKEKKNKNQNEKREK